MGKNMTKNNNTIKNKTKYYIDFKSQVLKIWHSDTYNTVINIF